LVEKFGTLFFIGLLTPGDVPWKVKTPSHQNRLTFQAVFLNSIYTKKALSSF
jgi:hypothetical protein